MRTLPIVVCLLVAPVVAAFPQSTAYSRSDEIASSFTKHKSVSRVKRGVMREKYKDVQTEPIVRQDITDYSGRYEVSDWGWWIDIHVDSHGRIQASGYEAGQEFELENPTLEGALLTATKVYRDGARARFEGVFMNRTERVSPSDAGVTTFGLGVLLEKPVDVPGMTIDRVFYRLSSE